MPDEDVTAAVGEAYRAYYRRLVAVVYAATGDYAEAQDVVQPLSMTFGGGYVGRTSAQIYLSTDGRTWTKVTPR